MPTNSCPFELPSFDDIKKDTRNLPDVKDLPETEIERKYSKSIRVINDACKTRRLYRGMELNDPAKFANDNIFNISSPELYLGYHWSIDKNVAGDYALEGIFLTVEFDPRSIDPVETVLHNIEWEQDKEIVLKRQHHGKLKRVEVFEGQKRGWKIHDVDIPITF